MSASVHTSRDASLERTFSRIVPWLFSGLFHVGLFLLMLFAVFLSPSPETLPYVPSGTVDLSRVDVLEVIPPDQPLPSNAKTSKPSPERFSRNDSSQSLSRTDRPLDADALIGVGTQGRGIGESGGEISTTPPGPPGDPFPRVEGRNFVYVIDRSGSMVDSFGDLSIELLRSISRLQWDRGATGFREQPLRQRFDILFFSDGAMEELPPGGLQRATRASRLAAAEYLKTVSTVGRTDPLPALERAFDLLAGVEGPNVIYLLTDARFSDTEAVRKLISRRNREGRVAVYTSLFGPAEPAAVEPLKSIAKENGGRFTHTPYE